MHNYIARIEEPSQISEVRRCARELAVELEFNEHVAEKAAIIVTEACTNLLKHANGGQIIIGHTTVSVPKNGALEILAIDKGAGIGDLNKSLADGHSTAGTAGTGLGAITRLSSYWEIYSRPNQGTALLSRVTAESEKLTSAEIAAVRVAKPGQQACGDDWGMIGPVGRRTVVVADGLGHGPDAAQASRTAVETLYHHPDLRPGELVEAIHDALRHTRGAAVAVAEIDNERGIVLFAGLGNISATAFAPDEPTRRMVSLNGTAGLQARHAKEFTYPWTPRSTLVLHSDGVGTHWSLADYPGLFPHDPAVIAGVIYRDHVRGNDDATVVVVK